MKVSQKMGLLALWCAGLLTVLGCNLLFALPEPKPTMAPSLTPATATPNRATATPPRPTARATTGPTPLATLLRALVPTARPVATATASATPQPPTARVNADLVNLRGGPGTGYSVVGQIRASAEITIVGRTAAGDWWQICCPQGEQEESWISAALVDLALSTDQISTTVPLATIPPLPALAAPARQAASVANAGGSGNGAGVGLPGAGGFGAVSGTNPFTGQGGGQRGQRPILVCVNNDYAARPQFGLGQADIVYEYLMEGYGITRFSALFYGEESSQIGPIRSARLINYYLGALYDAGLACSGASDQVRYTLKHEAPFPYLDIDLDDPSNARYSASIGSDYRTRLRTSTGGLRRWLGEWGVEKAPNVRGYTFGGVPNGGVPATTIAIPYPASTGSQVRYQYEGSSGRYTRWLGGIPHVDGNSGGQLAVENVIVQVVTHEATNIVEDSLGSTSIRLNLFGSGPAILFRDGQAHVGSWRSESRGDLPRFFNAAGAEIPLKPGKSWISIVPPTYTVTYQ
ncbi:MAG: DUF3048 domain-containing protein [Caldilineaceae bacterium]|nr:DUF3048 domain-containing protein [Caldilineaceae bacterium]